MITTLTIDEFDTLYYGEFKNDFKISEPQYLKMTNFIETAEDDKKKVIIFKEVLKTKHKIILQTDQETIKLFLKIKTDKEKQIEKEILENDTFNSYDNMEYWN